MVRRRLLVRVSIEEQQKCKLVLELWKEVSRSSEERKFWAEVSSRSSRNRMSTSSILLGAEEQ
jgi:hypothetical protein